MGRASAATKPDKDSAPVSAKKDSPKPKPRLLASSHNSNTPRATQNEIDFENLAGGFAVSIPHAANNPNNQGFAKPLFHMIEENLEGCNDSFRAIGDVKCPDPRTGEPKPVNPQSTLPMKQICHRFEDDEEVTSDKTLQLRHNLVDFANNVANIAYDGTLNTYRYPNHFRIGHDLTAPHPRPPASAMCKDDAADVFLQTVWDGKTPLHQLVTKHPEIFLTFFGSIAEAQRILGASLNDTNDSFHPPVVHTKDNDNNNAAPNDPFHGISAL